MRSKKTTILSLILVLALSLTACATNDDNDNGGTTDPANPTTTTIP